LAGPAPVVPARDPAKAAIYGPYRPIATPHAADRYHEQRDDEDEYRSAPSNGSRYVRGSSEPGTVRARRYGPPEKSPLSIGRTGATPYDIAP